MPGLVLIEGGTTDLHVIAEEDLPFLAEPIGHPSGRRGAFRSLTPDEWRRCYVTPLLAGNQPFGASP